MERVAMWPESHSISVIRKGHLIPAFVQTSVPILGYISDFILSSIPISIPDFMLEQIPSRTQVPSRKFKSKQNP